MHYMSVSFSVTIKHGCVFLLPDSLAYLERSQTRWTEPQSLASEHLNQVGTRGHTNAGNRVYMAILQGIFTVMSNHFNFINTEGTGSTCSPNAIVHLKLRQVAFVCRYRYTTAASYELLYKRTFLNGPLTI